MTGAKKNAQTVAHAGPEDREFFRGLGRAAGGAVIFALPMLMTMELWQLGFEVSVVRLAVLTGAMLPVLVALSRYGGFRETTRLADDVADALVAYLVGLVMSAAALWLFGLISTETSIREAIGKLVVQAAPASLGAILARSQLRGGDEEDEPTSDADPEESYGAEIFLMGVGALFLSLNMAPTEEIVLIAHKMNVWQELTLALLSLGVMHAFVYSLNFRGGSSLAAGATMAGVFARYTVVGYALVLLISLASLWVFGRTDGTSSEELLSATVVLAFPGAVGAAAARLLL